MHGMVVTPGSLGSAASPSSMGSKLRHRPCAPRNVGMPLSALTPAPAGSSMAAAVQLQQRMLERGAAVAAAAAAAALFFSVER